MAALQLHSDMPVHELASHLRRAFSGLVAGDVKAFGIQQVTEHGPYLIDGDRDLLASMDDLLRAFVKEKRMKLGLAEA